MRERRLKREVEQKSYRWKAFWLVSALAVITGVLFFFKADILLVYFFVVMATIIFVIYEIYGRTSMILLEQQWKFKHQEALLNIFSVLRPQILLPSMTDHAVAPDLAVIIIDKLQKKDIQFIVELGSGASSILVGLYLKQRGYGRLVSLEHDKVYADKIRTDVQRHEVQDFVEIRYASLLPVPISNVTYSWYDPVALEDLHSIDLLFVDGPPKTVSKLARYPAMPLLVKRLDKEAIVLLDDSKRDDERKIVKKWEEEFNMNCIFHDTEKGVTELSFNLGEQGQL